MHLLSASDLSISDVNKIFSIADMLAENKKHIKLNKFITLFFEKPSTRTRLSFEVAIAKLGGSSAYIDPQTTHRSRGETLEDTARIIGMYSDFIAARMYRHSDLKIIADNSEAIVINALTDLEHPTQALADVYTMRMFKKNLKNTKLAYIGDIASNTANSLMILASKLGIKVNLIGPEYYPVNKDILNISNKQNIKITNSIKEGVIDIDFIYTDTFVSMGQEAEALERKKLFMKYQLNDSVLKLAGKNVKVMHCLPAHRGEEITKEVLDGKQSIIWQQAKNKLLINMALIVFLSAH
ncbi:MAG: ornithine carbamoyltransferase [Candidatus Micrarchaeia archaeon]